MHLNVTQKINKFLNEGGSECFHRIRKHIRLHSTRKTSRVDHMNDMFYRCMDLTDPVIATSILKLSSFREKEHDVGMPPEVARLLEIPNGCNLPPSWKLRQVLRGLDDDGQPRIEYEPDIGIDEVVGMRMVAGGQEVDENESDEQESTDSEAVDEEEDRWDSDADADFNGNPHVPDEDDDDDI